MSAEKAVRIIQHIRTAPIIEKPKKPTKEAKRKRRFMSLAAKAKNHFVKTKTLSDEENQLRLAIIRSYIKYQSYTKVLSKF